MALRDARRDEVARIVQLLADDQLGSTRENAEDITEYLRAFDAIVADPNNSLLVWEEGNMVAGCLQLTLIPGLSRGGSWRAQIESVRVASDHRGQRIGWKMMEAVIAMARARGCSLMQLTTDKQRIDAHRFYQRLGFVSSHEGMKLKL